MKLQKTIIASALILSMGTAFAEEPVALNDVDMDNVSAARLAVATAGAIANGFFSAGTITTANTSVWALASVPTQGGQLTKDLTTSFSFSSGIAM